MFFDDLIPPAPAQQPAEPASSPAPSAGAFDDLVPPRTRITVRPERGPPEWQGPVEPDMGTMPAMGVGAVQGATANFADELVGMHAASGSPLPAFLTGPIPLAVGAGRVVYERLTGQDQEQQPDPDQPPTKGPGTTAYEQARDRFRATVQRAERQHPVAYTTGMVGGALLTPVKAAAATAPMRVRAFRGATTGGAMGGVAGAGEGTDLGDRGTRAATGAALGTAIGAVAPGASDVVVGAVRRGSEPLRRGFNRTFRPEREAQRRVATTLQADRVNDPGAAARLAPDEFVPGHSRLVDLGSTGTRRELDRAAQLSGDGDTVVRQLLQHRAEGERGRFVEWARRTFNFPDTRATERALQRESRAVIGPRYRQAYADGDRAIWSPELERVSGSPHVAAAMAKAAKEGKSIAIAEGHGAFNPPVTVTPDGRVIFNRGQTGVPTYPNLQFWDYTKRALDGMVTKLQREGQRDEARVVSTLRAQLRDELDNLVPSYRPARNSALEFFGASNAREAGENFFSSAGTFGRLDDARAAIATMNSLQRQLFQDAYVSRFVHWLRSQPDNVEVWKKIARSETARDELDLAISPALRQQLEAMVRLERIQSMAREAVRGNSQTARRIADWSTGAAAGTSLTGAVAGAYSGSPETTGISMIVGALAAGRRVNDRRVAERVARLLMSDNPNAGYQAVRMVAQNDRLMNRLRQATDGAGARGLPPQTTGVVGPQATGVGRAEDDDEGVQRPDQQ